MHLHLNRRHVLLGSAALGGAALAGSAVAKSAAPGFPIRISANENPYGPGPLARAAIAAQVAESCRYPGRATSELLDKLQRREQVDRSQIVLGTGSGELLNVLAIAYCDRGEMVCAWPTFEFLPAYAGKLGCEVRKVPLDADLAHDLAAMAQATSANTGLVYVCNPNNPTGTAIDGPTLRRFCSEMSQRCLVVVDEAYVELMEDGATESMIDLVRAGANVVVLRTFSKIHGLAGLRIGYAVARPEVAARLRRFVTTMPNTLGIAAASASVDDTQFLAATRKALLADRQRLVSQCQETGTRYARSQGNFVFLRVGMPFAEFQQAMQAERINVSRSFDLYPDWSRITIGTTAEMDYVLPVLRRIIRP